MPSDGRTLLLIDVYALVYRAFFALPPLTAPDGRPVNAVYGFERMLNRVLNDEKPTHVIAAWDAGIPAERMALYPEYKANRAETPDDLRSQFALVRRALAAYGIPIVEVEGEEADDAIATLTTRASADGLRTIVVSGDLDLLQLVDDHVTVVVTRRGISDMARYDEAAVRERYGLSPSQLPDYRGLKGDPSDNLPGVPGIGEKTAARLIAQYGTLDHLLEHTAEVTPKRIGELLERYAAQARACRDVSKAKRDLAIPLRWEDGELRSTDPTARNELFQELGFRSLMTTLPGQGEGQAPSRSPAVEASQPSDAADANEAPVEQIPTQYRLVADRAAAIDVLAAARRAPEFALVTLPAVTAWRSPEPLAFALSHAAGSADAIPAALALRDATVRDAFAELLADANAIKIVHDSKTLAGWLAGEQLELAGVGLDAKLAHELLDASRVEPPLPDTLAFAGTAAVLASPVPQTQRIDLFEQSPALEASHASAADALLRAAPRLRERINAAGMESVLRDIEQPLAPVLASMERAGFRLDLEELTRIRGRLDRIMAETSAAIYSIAGHEFNINSPKALGDVLFEKLALPHGGKTKTGYATGIEVLAPLAVEHDIAAKVIEFREVSKLKGTYVDALPALLDPNTGLLHTTFHQLGAATGRLSSSDPNLQNIPIRSAAGREIRRAFLAPTPGNVLLAADYSQIELRLLAHFAEDPNLVDAFARGEDIHEYAARAVFIIAADAPVDREMRRRAKAVNFGVLYGQGEFGLAQSVGFSREEAREFIGAYFTRFPRVREYIDAGLERARDQGYVTTLMGRRRWLPDLRSRNYGLRAAAERMAMNAPLQGSAADLIKIAMVRVARELRERDLQARLVLQVHDELMFDVAPSDVPAVRGIVKDAMEHAIEVRVPLVVDFKVGPTWGEAEAADD
jgi:DNA polymerase-1